MTFWGRSGSAHLSPDQWTGLHDRSGVGRMDGGLSQCISIRCPDLFILLSPRFVEDWKNTDPQSPVFSLIDFYSPHMKQNLTPCHLHPLGTWKTSHILVLMSILQRSLEEHIYPMSVVWHYSWGNVDKHLSTPAREPMTDHSNSITKFQLKPMSWEELLTEI